jgi:hypothetical protein
MIRLILGCLKLTTIVAVVLIGSQITVGDKRICDHVQSATQSRLIQAPIEWIATKFDHAATSSKTLQKLSHEGTASLEHSKHDKIRLSGLLKR